MPCYHPLRAWSRGPGVKVSFIAVRGAKEIYLPCGRCVGCKLERSRQWAVRCVHEAKMWPQNCVITLTYNDANLPYNGPLMTLRYEDVQLFWKRLRKRLGPFRFFLGGEYGEANGRPHYHSALFGLDFPDKRLVGKSKVGTPLYSSAILDEVWGKADSGRNYVGSMDFESAAYIARYCVSTDDRQEFYEVIDPETGEIFSRVPEFGRMSNGGGNAFNRGGIGATWFDRYGSDVFPLDHVVSRGRVAKPPRYYDKLHERLNPEQMMLIRKNREVNSWDVPVEESYSGRLRAKETCAVARIGKRSL